MIAADFIGVFGIWFEGQRYFAAGLPDNCIEGMNEAIEKAQQWLDCFFSGKIPNINVPLKLNGTDFQKTVWKLLLEIPYGQTVTYGELAEKIALQQGKKKIAAQAVGNAVGRNPVSLIVPCHRVLGKNGSLTGYAGGIEKKEYLLKLENKIMKYQKGSI